MSQKHSDTMHSSFPRKDERTMYRPRTRDSLRMWIARVPRRLQNSPRLLVTLLFALLLFTWVYIGRARRGMAGGASVVMVAVLDMTGQSSEARVLDNVLENRLEYARAHGTLHLFRLNCLLANGGVRIRICGVQRNGIYVIFRVRTRLDKIGCLARRNGRISPLGMVLVPRSGLPPPRQKQRHLIGIADSV